jgi:hypothetical protein
MAGAFVTIEPADDPVVDSYGKPVKVTAHSYRDGGRFDVVIDAGGGHPDGDGAIFLADAGAAIVLANQLLAVATAASRVCEGSTR